MTDAATSSTKAPSRIQQRNRILILDAALEVFSRHGYRGATLDQIAKQAGLSKPNILYYFGGKEDIHVTLLNQLMKTWLDPLKEMNPSGDPIKELLGYVHRKLDMALELPRESRLFANEILQGAPRMGRIFRRISSRSLTNNPALFPIGWTQEKSRVAIPVICFSQSGPPPSTTLISRHKPKFYCPRMSDAKTGQAPI